MTEFFIVRIDAFHFALAFVVFIKIISVFIPDLQHCILLLGNKVITSVQEILPIPDHLTPLPGHLTQLPGHLAPLLFYLLLYTNLIFIFKITVMSV